MSIAFYISPPVSSCLPVYCLAPPYYCGMAEQLPPPENQQPDQPVPQPYVSAV